MTEHEKIEDMAARWVAREDRGLGVGEAADLQSWLEQSDANRIAYLRLRTGWENASRLSALRPALQNRNRLSLAVRLVGMTAVTVILLLGSTAVVHRHAAVVAPHHDVRLVYATEGRKRPVLLADGTRIQLNEKTRVETAISTAARTVKLDRGEAYFEVAHEAKRPFVVMVGNRRITDLGTKFSVRRDDDNIRIVVTEGRVKIDVDSPSAGAAPVYAKQGDVVIAKADETLVTSRSPSAIRDALSWRSETLTFTQMTLEDAAAQFNKYNRRQIVVRGNARGIRIGGSFRSDNIDAFASLVQNALGLKVSRNAGKITISD